MKKHLEELNAEGKDDLSRAYENLNTHLISAEKDLMTALQTGAEPGQLCERRVCMGDRTISARVATMASEKS